MLSTLGPSTEGYILNEPKISPPFEHVRKLALALRKIMPALQPKYICK